MTKDYYFQQVEEKDAEIKRLQAIHIAPLMTELGDLEQKFLEACPFKQGDKVVISPVVGGIDEPTEAFISGVYIANKKNSIWSCDGYEFTFYKVKKDGSESSRPLYVHPRSLLHINKV